MLTVTNPADTRILEITVNSADPEEATVMANEYADVARNYIYEVMGTDEPSLFSVALQPTDACEPEKDAQYRAGRSGRRPCHGGDSGRALYHG